MGLKIFSKLSLLIFLVASVGFSQVSQRSFNAIQNPTGGGGYAKLGASSSVYVCTYNTGLTCNSSNYINIFSDINLVNRITQPVLSDLNGIYQYFIASGTTVVEKVCFTASQCQSYRIYFSNGAGGSLFGAPSCAGVTPAVGQTVTYTTTNNPSPCWYPTGGINLYVNGTLVASGLTGVTVNGH